VEIKVESVSSRGDIGDSGSPENVHPILQLCTT
jgi:hypothetical protein